ncbi:asparaginase [Saccharothrix sp. MB29]|nr:asparaginase [Saccharothrix sp. MB29]
MHELLGKHAAMLATCVVNGWSTHDYLDPPTRSRARSATPGGAGRRADRRGGGRRVRRAAVRHQPHRPGQGLRFPRERARGPRAARRPGDERPPGVGRRHEPRRHEAHAGDPRRGGEGRGGGRVRDRPALGRGGGVQDRGRVEPGARWCWWRPCGGWGWRARRTSWRRSRCWGTVGRWARSGLLPCSRVEPPITLRGMASAGAADLPDDR